MTSLLRSPIHRVLEIPELLDMVFRFLGDASNASNARVCKKWSDIALDALWRHVDDLHRLFSILAPLHITSGNKYTFERLPASSDWIRFERCRRRIRWLSYQTVDTPLALHQSVFDDVARTRTSLEILPSMHTLEWNAPLPLCVMFMHSNVKRFFVRLPDVLKDSSPSSFLPDVLLRMPNITHLDLRMDIPMRSIEPEAVALLSGLTKLQKVTLPRYTLTSKIVEALSHLENLEMVDFQYHDKQGCGEPEDLIGFNPTLSQGAFPALWDLGTTMTFEDTARFFDMPFAPSNLTTLYLDSHMIETPADVLHLFTVLGDNCQLLQSLGLTTFVDARTPTLEAPGRDVCIDITTFTPLLRCPKLVSIELTHHYPIYLLQQDVEKLALTWPSLETLLLNNEPAFIDLPSLTIRALLPFARHCPNLRHLGLFVSASTTDLSSADLFSDNLEYSNPYPTFRSLRRLSMGVSVISDEGPVALFLSQICPLKCEVDSGVTWDESLDVADLIIATVQTRCEKWAKVAELLPLLTSLRMDERAKARALQAEVEDLRMRTAILKDSASIKVGDECVLM